MYSSGLYTECIYFKELHSNPIIHRFCLLVPPWPPPEVVPHLLSIGEGTLKMETPMKGSNSWATQIKLDCSYCSYIYVPISGICSVVYIHLTVGSIVCMSKGTTGMSIGTR